MTRGRWIAIAVVVILVALLGAAAPALMRHRAATLIRERADCPASVARVTPGLSAVTLSGVDLDCDFGAIHLESVDADIDWVAMSPTAVRVRGGRATLTRRPTRPGSGAGDSSAPTDPPTDSREMPISIEGLRLSVGEPVLFETTLRAEGSAGRWLISAQELETSAAHHPVVSVGEVELTLDLGEQTVEALVVRELEVAATGAPSLVDALRAWGRETRTVGAAASAAPESAPGRRGWEWLREGSSVRVEGGTIRDESGEALSDLEVELARISGPSFRSQGRGHPRGTGDVSWDVRADLESGSVDGPITLRDVPLSVFVPFLPQLPLHDPMRTLVSAEARVSTDDGGVVEFDGRLGLEGLALQHHRIASAPVLGIALEIEGRGRWLRRDRRVEVERGVIVTGGARATVSGRATMDGDHYALELRAELPSTPCDVAVHAIPAGFLQDLGQMHLEGRIAAGLSLSVDSERLDDTTLRVTVDDRCTFTAIPTLADVTRFAGPFEHEVVEPEDRVFRMETGPGTLAWTPITEISPFLVHAVLAHEDASFFTHSGFAPWAIRDALVRNLRERRYVLGASTITMQLVKNVFLRREKTLARKVQEVLLTWWIESAMTKAQILELYLNVIEYGPSVYGIRNAAAHYFGRAPGDLSVAQSAYLAMILPNPPGFHEHYETNTIPPSFRRRLAGFIGILEHRGRIDTEASAQGREELEVLSFSRGGERVGPEVLRGGAAQLPIDGFSGYPVPTWDEGDPEEATADESESDQAPEDDGWEEVWP